MKQYFDRLGISLNADQLNKLEKYYEFLIETNEKFNLTAVTERNQAYEKHFADSMVGAELIKTQATLCDVGSGAGFPGVPLKILRNDISLTVVDSLQKRVNFLNELFDKLSITANAVHDRAEDFAKANRNKFDVVTARAVAPLNVLLEYVAAIAKINGRILAYKTDDEERKIAEKAAKVLGLEYEFCKNYTLSDGAKRCILVYKKVRETPLAYPRQQNKPRKSPL